MSLTSYKEDVMATTIQKQVVLHPEESFSKVLLGLYEKACGCFWFTLCLLLFIALGPFSAPVALIALLRLGLEENDQAEPASL
jgi:hypothetical protein